MTASAQSIQTVAGGGTDDGKLATEIALYGPRGIAYDSAGNLYVVEENSSLVRRIDGKTGTVRTLAGNSGAGFAGDGSPAKNATLNHPGGIAVDRNGDIYIADHDNGRVRKISASTGIISTVAGRGSDRPDGTIGDGGAATDAVLRGPWGLWLQQGVLYILETGYLGERVRKVVLSTGIITTLAGPLDGTDGFAGDGQPATNAKFNAPLGVAADAAGNVYVADNGNDRVRRIDAATGIIDTYAGGGSPADGIGDGGQATTAKLDSPTGFSFDSGGNLLILTFAGVRRVDKNTRVISTAVSGNYGTAYFMTVDANFTPIISSDGYGQILRFSTQNDYVAIAGGGSYIGDGLDASAAVFRSPYGLALDGAGNLFVADAENLRVRRVDAVTGIVTTYAGSGTYYDDPSQDGTPATTASMYPVDVAFDPKGDLYICDRGNARIKKVATATGILTFYAGGGNPPGGNNEGVSATSAKFSHLTGIGFDPVGNLYVTDRQDNRVWRIDGKTGIVNAFAGNGKDGFSGDGGPATAASLSQPSSAVSDSNGIIYISDTGNLRIRRVGKDGAITTFAGDGTDSLLTNQHIAIDPRNGDVYVADDFRSSVRKIDSSGKMTTIAGAGTAYYLDAGYQGDGGPATAALMNFPFEMSGVAVSKTGDVYVSDSRNNRVRAVFACSAVTAPALKIPADGTAGAPTAPQLTWGAVPKAFRYDLRLDTVSPPQKVAASDLSQTSFVPANLQPSTKYYWQVAAKGDPFCTPLATAASTIASFTTTSSCGVAAFTLNSPTDLATGVALPVQLTWQAASGAAAYDVYLGGTNPPPLVTSGITATTFTASVAGGRYYWFVVAHAACDPTKTVTSDIRSFATQSSSCTPGQIGVTLSSPADASTDVPLTTDLKWSGSGAVDAYDIYFGTDPNPPLSSANISATTQTVSSLRPATKYYWRVVARGPCDPNGVGSSVLSFTTRTCSAPGATTIQFAPSTVSAGSTYTIVWSQAVGADQDAGYLVERSTSADFSSAVEAQVTSSTAASFVANATGTYYHRVRAVAGCDVSVTGPVSAATAVSITAARPNVVFTLQPSAVITALGDHLEDATSSFALENLGGDPLQVIVGRQELNGAPPFFSITDPSGGDVAFVTLEPHQPRTFTVRFSGPRNNAANSYQGVIFLASTGQGLPVTPYAFVNLKVGGTPSAAPQFIVSGAPADYAAFSAFAGDDSSRPPLQIGVKNNGAAPVEVGFEIGPEVWLTTDATWNATRIEPGATRTVNLLTRRARAPNGSPLPRYTYLTVRTKDGASSRLLVQDNDDIPVTGGRSIRLDAAARSFIIPEVVSRNAADGSLVATRVRLTNIGTDAVQAELIFTPAGSDGFDPTAVRRATVLVPPNDVVTITDPAVQLLRLTRPASGQIEVRIPRERLGLVSVSASTAAIGARGSYGVPIINRGEGARLGAPHVLPGIARSSSLVTSVVFAETSGIDHAAVHATLIAAAGTTLGTVDADVPRYGFVRFDDLVAECGAAAADAARLDIRMTSGGGALIALGIVHAPDAAGGASLTSVPAAGTSTSSAVARILRRAATDGGTGVSLVVPVIAASTSSGAAPAYRTSVGLTAPAGSAIDFVMTFRGTLTLAKTISVPGGTTRTYQDVLGELFALPSGSQGTLFVDTSAGGLVYATLQAAGAAAATPSSFLPIPSTVSEALTSASSSARPLLIDGLEQSTDPTRGSRWMLLLNEVAGASGSVEVLLYESGNRSTPIAAREFAIAPFQQLQLDTVFALLGLDAPPRRKDRTNVQCVVVATRGAARFAAAAIAIDNVSGETKVTPLAPVVGSGPPGVSVVSAVIPQTQPPSSGRRRAAPH